METLVQAFFCCQRSCPWRQYQLVQVQSGGGGNPSLSPGRATGTVPSSVVSASIPLSLGRSPYLPTQRQASYRSASSSPSACRLSSCFDVDNEEIDARENVVVADKHADICTSAERTMMTMLTTVISMTLSVKSSALHSGTRLLSTLISLSAPSTPTSTLLALTFSLSSHLPPPLLLLLLLLGSPSEIQ